MFAGLFHSSRLLPVPHSALQHDFGMDNTKFFFRVSDVLVMPGLEPTASGSSLLISPRENKRNSDGSIDTDDK